ncbi:MAG: hypothetical protein NC489_08140 [Ruminococcus flavefaciens]|nr:hypothetical protein [Ruminococcus flavefaciens]
MDKFYSVGILMDNIAALPLFKEWNGDTMFDFNTIIPLTDDDCPKDKWGCPYNTSDTIISSRNTISFLIPESLPYPIFRKLSEMYPDVDVHVSWMRADGAGSGTKMAMQVYRNGVIQDVDIGDVQ